MVDPFQGLLHVALHRLVGQHDHGDGRLLGAALLDDGGDADLILAQDTGDQGQDARLVQRHDPEVVPAPDALHGPQPHALGHRPGGEQGDAGGSVKDDVVGDLDEVRHHRGCRGHLPRPPAREHQRAGRIAADVHGVVHPAHRGQQVGVRDHGGVHPHLQLPRILLGDGQELDAVPQLPRKGDVHSVDLLDALDVDVGEADVPVVGQGGQDLQLVGRVQAAHVQGRIRLGVALGLGLGQHLGEGLAGLGHLGQDVVRGPVDDAHDGLDVVRHQALTHRPDDGDGPTHAGLEAQIHPLRRGRLVDLQAVLGQQGLVGRDQVLPLLHRLQAERSGHAGPADQLHHDIHLGVVDHLHGVGGEQLGVHGDPGRARLGDPADAQPRPDPPVQQGGMVLEELHYARSDRAHPQDANVDGFH